MRIGVSANFSDVLSGAGQMEVPALLFSKNTQVS